MDRLSNELLIQIVQQIYADDALRTLKQLRQANQALNRICLPYVFRRIEINFFKKDHRQCVNQLKLLKSRPHTAAEIRIIAVPIYKMSGPLNQQCKNLYEKLLPLLVQLEEVRIGRDPNLFWDAHGRKADVYLLERVTQSRWPGVRVLFNCDDV